MSKQYDPTIPGQQAEILGGVHTLAVLNKLYVNIPAGSSAYTSDQGQVVNTGGAWSPVSIPRTITSAEITAGITPLNFAYPEGDIRSYGLTFGTSDKSAWDNCRAVCTVTGRPMRLSGLTLKLLTPITWDYVLHGIEGEGATLDFSAVTGAVDALVIDSATSSNAAYPHVFRNFTLLGPGGGSTVNGIRFGGTHGQLSAISDFAIDSFQYGLTWGNQAWLQSISNFQIQHCQWAINYPSGLTNSGECINFTRGCVANNTNGIQANGGTLHFTGISVDYNTNKQVYALGGAQLRFNQWHIEANTDNDYWILCQDASSTIQFGQGDIFNTATAKTAFPIGQCSNTGAAQITFVDAVCQGSGMSEAKYGFGYLIDGHCSWLNQSYQNQVSSTGNNSAVPCNGLNLLLDGGFEKSTIVDWMAWGTNTQAAISTAQHHSGSHSMAHTPSAGQVPNEVIWMRCEPGANVLWTLWTMGTSIGTDVLYFNITFYDRDGNSIATNAISRNITTIPAAWTRYAIAPFGQVPFGAAWVNFSVQKRGPGNTNSDGNGIAFYDDMQISITGPSGRIATPSDWPPFSSLNKTAAYSFGIPRGFAIEGIRIVNSTANAVTGGIKVGTASGGTQIAAAIAVGANADVYVPGGALTLAYPVAAAGASTLFFDAVSAFNSASLTTTLYVRRVISQGY